jgi:phenylpropionate dioxygenase-like ring-hydroxylating dioxygenase large terminal subunit
VSKDQGCSSIIGCRYHGWSYNTNGQLVKVIPPLLAVPLCKAPSFDKIPEFEKSMNNLFPIHVHVTEQGLLFVNLSADENVTSFEVQLQELLSSHIKEYHKNISKEFSSFDFNNFELFYLVL